MKKSDVAGWIGMVTILVVYGLTSTERIEPAATTTHAANLIGGLLLAWNSFHNGAKPVGTLNLTWSVIAAYGIVRGLMG